MARRNDFYGNFVFASALLSAVTIGFAIAKVSPVSVQDGLRKTAKAFLREAHI